LAKDGFGFVCQIWQNDFKSMPRAVRWK